MSVSARAWASARVVTDSIHDVDGGKVSTRSYMDTNGDYQDGIHTKVYDGMDQNGNSAGVHVPKLDEPRSCWKLT